MIAQLYDRRYRRTSITTNRAEWGICWVTSSTDSHVHIVYPKNVDGRVRSFTESIQRSVIQIIQYLS